VATITEIKNNINGYVLKGIQGRRSTRWYCRSAKAAGEEICK